MVFWIVDSGPSDHMTGDIYLVRDFQPYSKNYTMHIANDSISKVSNTGSDTLSKNLTLELVLLVSKLDCNLLSISQIALEKNCVAKYFPNHYVFQELNSG